MFCLPRSSSSTQFRPPSCPVGGISGESCAQGFPSTLPLYLPGVPCTQGSPTIHEVPPVYQDTVDTMFSELQASLGLPVPTAQSVPGYNPGNPELDYVPGGCMTTAPVQAVRSPPSASVGCSHTASFPNCREKVSIFAIPARCSYLESPNGTLL